MSRFCAAAIACVLILIGGCRAPLSLDGVEVRLAAGVPTDSTGLKWSPMGMKLPLTVSGDSATTRLALGPLDTPPITLRLVRSGATPYYDRLYIDLDRNGLFDDGEPARTEPSETRGRMWSTFEATLSVPVVDPRTGLFTEDPYPAAFWFVVDPAEPEEEPVLRMSRRGWMEGDTVVDGLPVRVLVAESEMDGVFDERDQWSIADMDSVQLVYGYQHTRSIATHNWLGETAWRIVEIDPSGRYLRIESGDPGITRAEEAEQLDKLAVDRRAPRSGRSVRFETDFETAESLARSSAKPLFVDFRTEWCGPCFTMDEWVFTADAVVDAAAPVVAVRVDGDDRRDLTKRFSVSAYPTLLMLSPDGSERGRFVGYLGVDSTALFLREPFTGTDG